MDIALIIFEFFILHCATPYANAVVSSFTALFNGKPDIERFRSLLDASIFPTILPSFSAACIQGLNTGFPDSDKAGAFT